MNILFIYVVPPVKEYRMGYNQGIGFLSSILKTKGHKTTLLYIDAYNKQNKQKINNKIKYFKPNLIGFSCASDQFIVTKEIVIYLNKHFDIPIILGGVHATVAPEEAITIPGLTGICVGEGEYALLEFVESLEKGEDITKIKNFWIKKDNKIYKNVLRPLIENLDELPFPDRELFDYKTLLNGYYNGLEFLAGRGCPFQCAYCINPYLQKIYAGKGKFVRWRSVDNLLTEMKRVIPKYKGNFNIITFHDDTFTLDKKWFREFSEKYSQEIGFPFRCATRADMLDEEMLDLLKKANCKEIWIGVESGDENMRNKILNKSITDQQVIKVFNLAKQKGIKTTAFNMIGCPFETESTIKRTIDFNKKIHADNKMLTIFQPYPGTVLGKLCKEKNWITKKKVSGLYQTTILNQPSIDSKKIDYYKSIFHPTIGNSKFLPLIKIMCKIRIGKNNLYEICRKRIAKSLNNKQREFVKKIVWGT